MSTDATNAAPAAWYSDPSNASQERYWDGFAWTDHHRPYTGTINAPAYVPAAATVSVGNGFSIAAMIFGGLAVLFLPIIFGPIGLILGAVAKSKGEPKAKTALIVAGVGMIVGFFLGALVALAGM